jgi:hypothetical protein
VGEAARRVGVFSGLGPSAWAEEDASGKVLVLDFLGAGVGKESVSLAWLEEALAHAYAHRQMQTLAYLEAIMEDVVFVMEMAAPRKPFTVG